MMGKLKKLTGYRLFLPLSCLIIVLLINLITTPTFFRITINNGVLYGYIIDVINRASELVVLAVGILAALVYIIRARLTVDRIIGINLIGTIVVMVIVVLTFLLGEDYLADIRLIYVVLSFIAVMMLCRIYINLYQRNQAEKGGGVP